MEEDVAVSFEHRQTTTAEALDALLAEIAANERRQKEQAEKGLDALTYFVFRALREAKLAQAENVSWKISAAFAPVSQLAAQ